jgi:hypothetical protein
VAQSQPLALCLVARYYRAGQTGTYRLDHIFTQEDLMSANNGVIRIGRKGIKKFAFGDDEPFEVDIVVAFQEWVGVDESFRPTDPDTEGNRSIPTDQMMAFHQAAVDFVEGLANKAWADGAGTPPPAVDLTKAEALDFIARLREQYDELAVFFRPKSREKPDSQDTSAAELRFSVESH